MVDVDRPVAKDSEVLIKVYAVSLNDWDFGLLKGDFVNRMISGWTKPKINILCSDIAGKVVTVGKNVNGFKTGDDVYGDLSGRWGGLAEYVCADAKSLALKPPSMSFAEAAAIPQAAMLAVQGLVDTGKLKPGHKLLINGAGGGVGTFGVQLAKMFNMEVTGVDAAMKLDMMRNMGFDFVIDYEKEDFTRNGRLYDLILDTKTNRSVFDYMHVLNPGGMYATVGGSIPRLLQSLVLGPWVSFTQKKSVRVVSLRPNKDLVYINQLYETGKIKPVIDGPFPFNDFLKAFQLFEKGQHKGKVVINIEE
jgi:NADPH:quinone reductase-like Zn-dependent oxidoreductase